MSLDFSLYERVKCDCGRHIDTKRELFSANITHNLGKMAAAAGIYAVLWRPEENGIETAQQAIQPLRDGLRRLRESPDEFKSYDSPNGWGLYVHFVPFVEKVLQACEEHPEARVDAWR